MRAVGKKEAAMVLHQVRDTITMKVQFNPVEYHHSGMTTVEKMSMRI